jgi:hypothetical protein
MRGKKIEVGDRFGRLVAVEEAGRDKHNHLLWAFACDCGGRITTIGFDVKRGKTSSCGCLRKEVATDQIIDVNSRRDIVYPDIGDQFGRLVVVSEAERDSDGRRFFNCVCSCGNSEIRRVSSYALIKGRARSCGCTSREKLSARQKTHGLSKTREYNLMHGSRRRAQERMAAPEWAKELTDLVMFEALEKAKHLENLTGEKHHIDHITPLCGYTDKKQAVCGLHIWYNLRVIPASQNLSKSYHTWDKK